MNDKLKIEYRPLTTDDLVLNGDLPMTQYGVEFLRLRRRASAGPAIV